MPPWVAVAGAAAAGEDPKGDAPNGEGAGVGVPKALAAAGGAVGVPKGAEAAPGEPKPNGALLADAPEAPKGEADADAGVWKPPNGDAPGAAAKPLEALVGATGVPKAPGVTRLGDAKLAPNPFPGFCGVVGAALPPVYSACGWT